MVMFNFAKNVRGANPSPSTPPPPQSSPTHIWDRFFKNSNISRQIWFLSSFSCKNQLNKEKANHQWTNLTHLNIDMGIPPLESTHKILVIFWPNLGKISIILWYLIEWNGFHKVFKRRYLNLTDNLAHQSESLKEKAKEEFHGKFNVFWDFLNSWK